MCCQENTDAKPAQPHADGQEVGTIQPKKHYYAAAVGIVVRSLHSPVTPSIFFNRLRIQRVLESGAAMQDAVDAAPLRMLCYVHLKAAAGLLARKSYPLA